ncbi:acyl-phosphate glycerol 3-phosphate acyltransferase [Sphingobium sp. 22B]|uniref:lysophospholipid acyltransferase family protein n=1 Tax=unclassified Sphingobium TaxID=2611147 RepID=UPI000783E41B|nr:MULTISPECIES: lysophospholipid acyltransferase family protein [unclassified Sphingobium]KXU30787.1 acyl-phosphate glycerol 3-phosphate acyltransferase [Sphingobium sp. AM]KYC34368.1 acyl-phosphate glycerol 3-phosphate acyltransferase [Sphingobium sp. 22B]OAP33981.1 acyl-phosphate glycerol 3-phosphate acyltransferase [Sphingobium sp. 20006FA]
MAALRRFMRLTALAASLLLCLIPHLLWRAARRRSPWPPRFLALAARSVGARVRIDGHPFQGDSFIIANHVSWVDILALGGATGAAFVAHDGIARWPVIGWLAAQNNTLFVARERRGALSSQLDALRAALAGHQPVALFPEGTTSDGTGLLPFKPSLLSVLLPPPRSVRIQPVHIDYGPATAEISWHSDEPAGANVRRLLERKGRLEVTLRFLEPFDPAICPDRKALAATARERIAASIAAHLPPFTCGAPLV